jgi:hypothetical protein
MPRILATAIRATHWSLIAQSDGGFANQKEFPLDGCNRFGVVTETSEIHP